jgi:hypothetical protein
VAENHVRLIRIDWMPILTLRAHFVRLSSLCELIRPWPPLSGETGDLLRLGVEYVFTTRPDELPRPGK